MYSISEYKFKFSLITDCSNSSLMAKKIVALSFFMPMCVNILGFNMQAPLVNCPINVVGMGVVFNIIRNQGPVVSLSTKVTLVQTNKRPCMALAVCSPKYGLSKTWPVAMESLLWSRLSRVELFFYCNISKHC